MTFSSSLDKGTERPVKFGPGEEPVQMIKEYLEQKWDAGPPLLTSKDEIWLTT